MINYDYNDRFGTKLIIFLTHFHLVKCTNNGINHNDINQIWLNETDIENLKYIIRHISQREWDCEKIQFYDCELSYFERYGNVSRQFSRICSYPIRSCVKNATLRWLDENGFVVEDRGDNCYVIRLPKELKNSKIVIISWLFQRNILSLQKQIY